jgi:hypothetical protein
LAPKARSTALLTSELTSACSAQENTNRSALTKWS